MNCDISLINNRNKNGPRTDPCGTPHVTSTNDDSSLWQSTACFRLSRQEENHFNSCCFIQYILSFCSRIEWLIVSKHLEVSRRHTSYLVFVDLQMVSNAENVSIWWRHHVFCLPLLWSDFSWHSSILEIDIILSLMLKSVCFSATSEKIIKKYHNKRFIIRQTQWYISLMGIFLKFN